MTATVIDSRRETIKLPEVRNYAPWQPGPSRVSMNLNALDLSEWIEVDERLPEDLAEKRRLLAERHPDVFAALPEAAAAAQETLNLLAEHLPAYYPQVYRKQGDLLLNRITGERWNVPNSSLHPLEVAGRLVQEDLCLMGQDLTTNRYQLIGACLCFPSQWRLSEKLGKPLDDIHVPVPGYATHLASSMNRLFDRFKANKPVWRVNWSLVQNPVLFQPSVLPSPYHASSLTRDNAGDKLWLRMERQTLRRLPVSNNILFTIRIYVHPLSSLVNQPDQAARLVAALRGLDETMQTYKSMQNFIGVAMAWLETVAATSK